MTAAWQAGSAVKGVLCADGHLGYAHPIGGVVAYEEHISISGVGFDIACGNMAVRLDTRYEDIAGRRQDRSCPISGAVISFGIGQKNAVKVDHDLFDSPLWEEAGVARPKTMARNSSEQSDPATIMSICSRTRTASSGSGCISARAGSATGSPPRTSAWSARKDGMEVDPALVHQDSDIGQSYLAGVKLGGLYAYAGREWVVERVRQIIGGQITDTVHNHHNFAWREQPWRAGLLGGAQGCDTRPSRASAASSAAPWGTTR